MREHRSRGLHHPLRRVISPWNGATALGVLPAYFHLLFFLHALHVHKSLIYVFPLSAGLASSLPLSAAVGDVHQASTREAELLVSVRSDVVKRGDPMSGGGGDLRHHGHELSGSLSMAAFWIFRRSSSLLFLVRLNFITCIAGIVPRSAEHGVTGGRWHARRILGECRVMIHDVLFFFFCSDC